MILIVDKVKAFNSQVRIIIAKLKRYTPGSWLVSIILKFKIIYKLRAHLKHFSKVASAPTKRFRGFSADTNLIYCYFIK
jgi:hypothetical protein